MLYICSKTISLTKYFLIFHSLIFSKKLRKLYCLITGTASNRCRKGIFNEELWLMESSGVFVAKKEKFLYVFAY